MERSTIAEKIWMHHKEWSEAANRLKASIGFWRNTVLLLAIGGAFLETLSTQVPAGSARLVTAWIGAAFLAVIPIVTPKKLSSKRVKSWVFARSASEGLKAEVFTYIARAAPYDGSPPEAAETLKARAKEIEDGVEGLVKLIATVGPEPSSPPAVESPADYIRLRVKGQENWYKENAGIYKKKSVRCRKIEMALAIAAALLAAATGGWGETLKLGGQPLVIGAWVAVLTTIGGTITTHIAASRYDHLVTSYSGTYYQLRSLACEWPPPDGGSVPSPAWSEFVRKCEDAISKENESWVAKWAKESD